MPIALAGLASILWGTADFLGGLASAAWRPERVAGVAQVVGAVVLIVLAPAITGSPSSTPDLAWGAAAGLTGAAGAALLYRSLAIGPMNVAAPTVAVVAAVVPAAVGLALGERPGALALVGVALAMVAVALVGRGQPGPSEPRPSPRVVAIAAAAGVGLGLANVAFAQTSPASGLWPVTTAKIVAAVVLGSAVVFTRAARTRDRRRGMRLATWTGAVDVAATTALAIALQRGSLVLISVLGSLFPAVTVLLARVLLVERIGRVQAIGLATALVAVAMIVAG